VLGEFTGQDKADAGLDLSRRYGRLLAVRGQLGGLSGDTLEDIIDERVKDGHGLVRDTSIRVDLLQHFVDVRAVSLLSRLLALLLLAISRCLALACSLLGSFGCFGCLRLGRRLGGG